MSKITLLSKKTWKNIFIKGERVLLYPYDAVVLLLSGCVRAVGSRGLGLCSLRQYHLFIQHAHMLLRSTSKALIFV